MRRPVFFVLCLIAIFCIPSDCGAQHADSTSVESKNIFQQALQLIYRNPSDSVKRADILNQEAVGPFLKYEGKVIRNIQTEEYGFEKSFTDTTKSINYFGTKILNYLHRDTRPSIVRNNLFIRPGEKINPYLLADNERHLRELNFIQDARILVKEVGGQTDSVDLVVVTKDLFSINGELKDLTPEKFFAKAGDANVLGLGQELEVTTLFQKGRTPGFGVGYKKNNISGSFINGYVDVSNVGSNIVNGRQNEIRYGLGLERPLVSQYLTSAGSISYSSFKSRNTFSDPSEEYFQYNGNQFDVWAGINLGVKKYLADNEFKHRQFVALRYLNLQYSQTPLQLAYNDWRFQNERAVLASFTLFKQVFFKTNYLYGFGNTEDIPTGYNFNLTSGWYKIASLNRFYAGVTANEYLITRGNDFIQLFSRLGGFVGDHNLEDANLMAGGTFFSRLITRGDLRMRQFFQLNYTQQFNRTYLQPLQINNQFGLKNFSSDSATGATRISLNSESAFFLRYRLFGFKFSPFAGGSVVLLKQPQEQLVKSDLFWSLAAGVRTRNENLIFGTVELRANYFPRNLVGNNRFKIMLAANLKFRSNSNYVHAPDIIRVNSDPNSEVYSF